MTSVALVCASDGQLFHCTRLCADEVTEREATPVTTASRTLLDLAAVLPRHPLERALREAEAEVDGSATPRRLGCSSSATPSPAGGC